MSRSSARPLTARVSQEGYTLEAAACRAGDDLVVVVTGGEKPHVGCVVVSRAHASSAQPDLRSVTSSVLAAPPHREEALARPLAEALARTLGGTVVVAAGVHDDGLSHEGIAIYLRLGERLADELLQALKA